MAKEVADAAVEHDELAFVLYLYRIVLTKVATMTVLLSGNDRQIFMPLPPFGDMMRAIETFTVEVMTTLSFGELKLGQVERFLETQLQVRRIRGQWPTNWAVVTIGLLDRFLSSIVYQSLYTPISNVNSKHTSIADHNAVSYPEEMGDRPYLTHDSKILARHPDQSVPMTAEYLPLDQCAAVCLPFTSTSYYKTAEYFPQKALYNGWQDVKFLRSLSQEVKEEIRAMQEAYGFEETYFTEL
jgi:hypothetical protein